MITDEDDEEAIADEIIAAGRGNVIHESEAWTIEQALSWAVHRDLSFPPISVAQRRWALREFRKALKEGKLEVGLVDTVRH